MIEQIEKSKNLKTRPDQRGTGDQSRGEDNRQPHPPSTNSPLPGEGRRSRFAIVKEFSQCPTRQAETQIQLQRAITILEAIKDQPAPIEKHGRKRPERDDPQLSFTFSKADRVQSNKEENRQPLPRRFAPLPITGQSAVSGKTESDQQQTPNMQRRTMITEEIISAIARSNPLLNIKTLNESAARHFAAYLGGFLSNTPHTLAGRKSLLVPKPVEKTR